MARQCAVTRAYEAMPESDRDVFRKIITDPFYSAGRVAEILRHEYPSTRGEVDRLAVAHYRRKLAAGKAEL